MARHWDYPWMKDLGFSVLQWEPNKVALSGELPRRVSGMGMEGRNIEGAGFGAGAEHPG